MFEDNNYFDFTGQGEPPTLGDMLDTSLEVYSPEDVRRYNEFFDAAADWATSSYPHLPGDEAVDYAISLPVDTLKFDLRSDLNGGNTAAWGMVWQFAEAFYGFDNISESSFFTGFVRESVTDFVRGGGEAKTIVHDRYREGELTQEYE
jgi:hypothetical protein